MKILHRKTASGIGAIKHINHCLPPTALHDVYYGLLQLHFDYAAWYGVAVVKFCAINCSGSRTVPNVLKNSNYDADARKHLNDLGWQNLETQWLIHKAVMVYIKSLNCLAPDNRSIIIIITRIFIQDNLSGLIKRTVIKGVL